MALRLSDVEGGPETPAQRVRRLRRAKGWSLDDMVRETGMSRNAIARFEVGRSTYVLPSSLERYADALGVPVYYLQTGIWPAEAPPPPVVELAPRELTSLYSDLDDIQRRALLQIGHALREAQEAYEIRDIGRLASFSGATQEEQEQAKRDALDSGEHPD